MYSKLKTGDLLHRSKGIVEHAGVYLGNGQVLHNQPGKGTNITNYSEYSEDKEVKVTHINNTNMPLLKSRINEIIGDDSRYKLLENNCEHVAHYLISGRKLSPQIQAAIVGMIFGGVASNQFKKGHLLLWLAGGAFAGIMFSNWTKKYDYCITQNLV